ncbi:hypothetical protein E2C01_068999 [Portunus trituberculatus]|uniref:Uncharacterized protein n=1 Tax=Portunus trituberculatus TaxID=210409 RepID=A0A5B7HNY6_PORTR|nr:hypothetical protein [Portunus trituberculatus]
MQTDLQATKASPCFPICFSPLTPPYSGPYEVIERKEQAFLPAYLQDDDPPPVRFSKAGHPLLSLLKGAGRGGSIIGVWNWCFPPYLQTTLQAHSRTVWFRAQPS